MLSDTQKSIKESLLKDEEAYTREKTDVKWQNTDEKNARRWEKINNIYKKTVDSNDEEGVRNHLNFAQYVNHYEKDENGNKKSEAAAISGSKAERCKNRNCELH